MGQGNSPNKRQRLTPPNEFPAHNQLPTQGQPPNRMHPVQSQGNMVPLQNALHAAQILKQHGFQLPPNASQQYIMNVASNLYTNAAQPSNQQQLNTYNKSLAFQQSSQGSRASVLGAGGASPANQHAQIPFGNTGIRDPRIPTVEEMKELNLTAKKLGGTLSHPSSGSHSLQDYQSQLMLLEQQNKRRLQHARQETNTRNDEPGSGLMTTQFSQQGQGLQPGRPQLQGTSMSPSTSRTGPSPRMSNIELSQQQQPRKQGQKTGSGAASPEPDYVVNQGPNSSFAGQAAGMTHEQFNQNFLEHEEELHIIVDLNKSYVHVTKHGEG
jgi:hypothetical protein